MEERALTGESNVTFSIFALKNNFGWEDKKQVESNSTINAKVENTSNLTEDQLEDEISKLEKKLGIDKDG